MLVWSSRAYASPGPGYKTAVVVLDGPFDASAAPVFRCNVPRPSSRCGRVALTKSFSPSSLERLATSFRHATLVAATVAAAAPDTDVIVFNVYDEDPNFGPFPRQDAVLAALSWVRDHAREYGVVAVNISFGFPDHILGRCDDDPLAAAIRATRDAGVSVVAAVGNDGRIDGVARPACVTAATSVGATDDSSIRRATARGVGPALAAFTNRHALIDIFADGTRVQAGAERLDGTSFSAPLIAAAIARTQRRALERGEPLMSVDDVEEELRMHSVVSTGGPKGDDLRHFLAFDEHVTRAYAAAAIFALAPSKEGYVVGRVLVQSAENDVVQGAFLSLEIQTSFPELVSILVRSPSGREIKLKLPRTEVGHRYAGGDFNGILDETEAPNPFALLHGEPLNGEWAVEVSGGAGTVVRRARLYLR